MLTATEVLFLFCSSSDPHLWWLPIPSGIQASKPGNRDPSPAVPHYFSPTPRHLWWLLSSQTALFILSRMKLQILAFHSVVEIAFSFLITESKSQRQRKYRLVFTCTALELDCLGFVIPAPRRIIYETLSMLLNLPMPPFLYPQSRSHKKSTYILDLLSSLLSRDVLRVVSKYVTNKC